MSFLLLCSWSSIVIFVWMVKRKYHWTAPPYVFLLIFALAGVNSTFPAMVTNNFLGRETIFYAFSPELIESFFGFFIGAGLGEELFKLVGGLMVLLLLTLFRIDIGPAGRYLGFVVVGLAFATAENLFAYYWLEFWTMVHRGLLAVPFHAGMGMVHGYFVNMAWKRGSPVPIFIGYLASAVLHTYYDVATILSPNVDPRLILYTFVATLMLWGLWQWYRIAERVEMAADESTEQ